MIQDPHISGGGEGPDHQDDPQAGSTQKEPRRAFGGVFAGKGILRPDPGLRIEDASIWAGRAGLPGMVRPGPLGAKVC